MLHRRGLLKAIAATGIGTAVFQRSVAASMIGEDGISVEAIAQAEWITGLELTEEQRQDILNTVKRTNDTLGELRKTKIDADTPMAIHFAPTHDHPKIDYVYRDAEPIVANVIELPDSEEEIALSLIHI